MPAKNLLHRRTVIVFAVAIVLIASIWLGLRTAMAARLETGAQRDLQTIVDLVAANLERSAGKAPPAKGATLLQQAADTNPDLAKTLLRVSDENDRNIYFFDALGRIASARNNAAPQFSDAAATLDIVRLALASGLDTGVDRHGLLLDPYVDLNGEEVVGAWRWIAALELGIVAERPYDRFSQPIRWIDGTFCALILLAAIGYLMLADIDVGALRSTFRRPDLKTCGPYQIERQIGEGAMSNVYLAQHVHLKRLVALKRLKIHAQSDELAERFDREARLASQLNHPNIITVLDHGKVPEGGFYYAMEFISGLTLTQWVEQHGPVPPGRTVRLLRQICAALGAMHRRHLLHRDIKPDNVIAYAAHGDFDLVKLLDFGLIKDLENAASRDLTRDVRILGTPAFMAPERLLDPRTIDPRTDLYGVGCIGYFLLTGRKPFEATLDADLAQQVLHVPAPAVTAHSIFPIPPPLAALIAAALAKDIAQRPADAEAFGAALEQMSALVPWQPDLARLWWAAVHPSNG